MMSKGEVYGDMTGQRFGKWTVPRFDAEALIRFFKMR